MVSRQGVVNAKQYQLLVCLHVVRPTSITASYSDYLAMMVINRLLWANTPDTFGFFSRKSCVVFGGESLAMSGTKLGIVDITSIGFGLGPIIKCFPVFRPCVCCVHG